jgi:pimeloyl-ACP methyl ester carboxylesterase
MDIDEPAAASTTPHFFLVHGTWGRAARWARETSVLPTAIRAKFGEVTFHIFKWSGGNNHDERCRAAELLEREIKNVRASFPHAPIFLIGHSHGGNVCVRASYKATPLAGLVTLATPFIHVSIPSKHASFRRLKQRVGFVAGMPLLVIFLATFVIMGILLFDPPYGNESFFALLNLLYGGLGLFSVGVFALKKMQGRITRALFSRRTRAIERFGGFSIVDTDVLAAHYSFDEAHRVLRFYERFIPVLKDLSRRADPPVTYLIVALDKVARWGCVPFLVYFLALALFPRSIIAFLCSFASIVCTKDFGTDF